MYALRQVRGATIRNRSKHKEDLKFISTDADKNKMLKEFEDPKDKNKI